MIIPAADDARFLRENVVDIDAAVVGIHRTRWTDIDSSSATKERASEMMGEGRFDVLPIVDGTDLRQYYCTDNWGDFSSVSRKSITHRDVIPSSTHIREVIKGFTTERQHFFFLANERRIVGLISVVNLNCRQVKVYLFSLLSELEVSLANFIAEHLPEDYLTHMVCLSIQKPPTAMLEKSPTFWCCDDGPFWGGPSVTSH